MSATPSGPNSGDASNTPATRVIPTFDSSLEWANRNTPKITSPNMTYHYLAGGIGLAAFLVWFLICVFSKKNDKNVSKLIAKSTSRKATDQTKPCKPASSSTRSTDLESGDTSGTVPDPSASSGSSAPSSKSGDSSANVVYVSAVPK